MSVVVLQYGRGDVKAAPLIVEQEVKLLVMLIAASVQGPTRVRALQVAFLMYF